MKKSTKSMILALTAFSSIALAGCGISAKEDFIIDYTYETPSGSQVTDQITAQDILDRYLSNNGSNAAQAYYNAIYEVALREAFSDGGKFADQMGTVQAEVDRIVADEKNKANNADTSWEDYLINTLGISAEGLSVEERERQYRLNQEVAQMKEVVSDEFYDTFSQWNPEDDVDSGTSQEDIDEYNMVYGENGYLKTKLPYHVKDILIKVDADASDYSSGDISSQNAADLYELIRELTRTNTTTNTFGDVARRLSDDTASAENLGEHLMDLDESFINEFKLGVYTFDSIFNSATNTNTLSEKFLMPEDVQENLTDVGVNYIPYGAIVELYNYRNVETYRDPTTGQELTVNEGNANYYPRNIIFNKYFNSHNIGFIINANVNTDDPEHYYTLTDTGVEVASDLDENGDYKLGDSLYFEEGTSEANHFVNIPGLEYPVLADEEGNPIIMARSETSNAGIHFIAIKKSPLENQETASVKLNQYYAPVNPLTQNGQDSNGRPYYNPDFPVDSEGNQLTTFVRSSLNTDLTGYDERVSTLRDRYETYTSTNKDFQLFQWVTEGNYKAADDRVQAMVDQYINTNIFDTNATNEQSLTDDWYEYNEVITAQEEERKIGLIPETCAIHFGDMDYYGVGKLCYYTTTLDPNSQGNNN